MKPTFLFWGAVKLASPVLALAWLSGCTQLGPVAAVSGASAVPHRHADAELQVAGVPGYYLSEGVGQQPNGTPIRQLSGMVEPNDLIGVEGLGAGARYVGGGDGDGYFEPMLRYRRWLGDEQRLSLMAVGFGTHASGEAKQASYQMTRLGGELGMDVRLTPPSSWAELHVQSGAGLSQLFADGKYCMNVDTGWGRDCDDNELPNASVEVSGLFPVFYVGASVDIARHLDLFLHGVRIGGWAAGGTLPSAQHGEQVDARNWAAGGLGLTLGLGG